MKTKKITTIYYDKFNLTPYLISGNFHESLSSYLLSGNLIISKQKEFHKMQLDIRDILTINFKADDDTIVVRNFVVTKTEIREATQQNDIYRQVYIIHLIDADVFSLTYRSKCVFLPSNYTHNHITNLLIENRIKKFTTGNIKNKVTPYEFLTPLKPHSLTINFLINKEVSLLVYQTLSGNKILIDDLSNLFTKKEIEIINIQKDKYNVVNIANYDFYELYQNGTFGYITTNYNIKNSETTYDLIETIDEIEVKTPPLYKQKIQRFAFLNTNAIKINLPANVDYKVGEIVKVVNNNESLYDGKYLIFKIEHLLDNKGNWMQTIILSNLDNITKDLRG